MTGVLHGKGALTALLGYCSISTHEKMLFCGQNIFVRRKFYMNIGLSTKHLSSFYFVLCMYFKVLFYLLTLSYFWSEQHNLLSLYNWKILQIGSFYACFFESMYLWVRISWSLSCGFWGEGLVFLISTTKFMVIRLILEPYRFSFLP